MPLIRCPHCGDDTLTLTGWAGPEHCATCGRPLPDRRIEIGAVLGAKERLAPRPQASLDRREIEREAPDGS
jgi:hypothetical protein